MAIKHALPPGTPCYNCATPLAGPWCHACGQAPHDYHRSAWVLAAEALENFFHADGRLWRTLWRLLRNPARLTRDFLAGKRAPQVPPLRLFLVVLLILFVIANWATRGIGLYHLQQPPTEIQKELDTSHIELGLPPAINLAVTNWLHDHLSLALAHPDDLASAMRDRAENFAFLMLPISALMLALIFVARRGFVLFDHLVFSMHSLSFQGLLISLAISTGQAWLLWLAPVHLFAHMRGVYATGIAGTLLRMGVLFALSVIAFALLLLALVVAGMRVMRA